MKRLFFYICLTIVLAFNYVANLLEDAFSWWEEETEITKLIDKNKHLW